MPNIVVGRDMDDLQRFGEYGTLFIAKHIVGTGEDAHLTSPVLVDALRPHSIIICGKRGTGKSYTLGTMVEEIKNLPWDVQKNLSVLIVDVQGIFWTMKYPNDSKKTRELLKSWRLEPRGIDASVYVPIGQAEKFRDAGVKFDGVFSISPSQLSVDDWFSLFNLSLNDPKGIILQRVVDKLKKLGDFSLENLIYAIQQVRGWEKERMALENLIAAAAEWGIFGEAKLPEILLPGKVTILDVSMTPEEMRTVLFSIVANRILEERIEARRQEELAIIEGSEIKRKPMCWILIDEAHNFIPAEGKVASSDILLRLAKEGRQPGVSTIFATQMPNKLHPDIIAQSDIIISHRLTSKRDIEALKAIMQTYMLFDIDQYINELPKVKGTAIIMDDNSERIYKIRTRPRQSWHAGSSPIAVDLEKIEEF